jgi:hypothetical protein
LQQALTVDRQMRHAVLRFQRAHMANVRRGIEAGLGPGERLEK